MGILKKIEDVVKKTDFFYSKEMLRYDDDEDYFTLYYLKDRSHYIFHIYISSF